MEKVAVGVFGALFIAGVVVGVVCLNAWIIMVLWGALGSIFEFGTIGFGTAVLVGIALSVVGGFFRSATSR
jgi:hypothetical protein